MPPLPTLTLPPSLPHTAPTRRGRPLCPHSPCPRPYTCPPAFPILISPASLPTHSFPTTQHLPARGRPLYPPPPPFSILTLPPPSPHSTYTPVGAPTEVSLITAALKAGLSVEDVKKLYPRIASVPFESEHKFMATVHKVGHCSSLT